MSFPYSHLAPATILEDMFISTETERALIICPSTHGFASVETQLIFTSILFINSFANCHNESANLCVYIKQGPENFSCEGPHNKYFRLCSLYSLLH